MPSVDLMNTTFARLQKHAIPFTDTPDIVVNRALDALEKSLGASEQEASGAVVYKADAAPNLTHTKPFRIVLEGKQFPPELTYWNNLLSHLVRRAAELGHTPEKIRQMVSANTVLGERTVSGYKFMPEAGISIQGQDAAGAWKAIYSLTQGLSLSLEVEFYWYDKPEAANPGGHGRFEVGT